MKDLLLTTALITLIAGVPLHAQTSTGTDTTTDTGTTTDMGTTTDTGTGTDTGTMTDTTGSATDSTASGMGSTAAITPPEGYTEYDRMALTSEDLQGATVYDSNGESVGEISELVMAATSTGAAGSTDTAATGTEATGDSTTGMTDQPTGTTTTDGTAAGDSGAEVTMDGQVSHVVLDVGGFLGIGAHTVAVPMQALQVFRGANEDIRVYLPWTEAQLKALPDYDPNDPSTLGSAGGAMMDTDSPTGTTTDTGTESGTMDGTTTDGATDGTTTDGTTTDGTTTDGTTTDGTSN